MKEIAALRRRLERDELIHLRRKVLRLHKQREAWRQIAHSLHKQLLLAEESAEFWNRQAMDMQSALTDETFSTHRCVGINQSGEMMVVKTK